MSDIARYLNVFAGVAVIVVNQLANYLPLNGRTTGELALGFSVLFPVEIYVFNIWFLIYALIIVFIVYQFRNFRAVESLTLPFLASCTFNIAWIFLWHFEFIVLSFLEFPRPRGPMGIPGRSLPPHALSSREHRRAPVRQWLLQPVSRLGQCQYRTQWRRGPGTGRPPAVESREHRARGAAYCTRRSLLILGVPAPGRSHIPPGLHLVPGGCRCQELGYRAGRIHGRGCSHVTGPSVRVHHRKIPGRIQAAGSLSLPVYRGSQQVRPNNH